jgi:hypothetical protein
MKGRCVCLAVLLATLVPVRNIAAQPAQPRSPAPAVRAEVDKMPVSLARIRRGLERVPTFEERFENFRLLTIQNVYGFGPGFELFTPDDAAATVGAGAGAARYGGVTHSEFLSQVAPRNFQAPVMNLSGGVMSLTNWAAQKRREAQRRKEAEARKRQLKSEEVGSRK